MHPTGNEYKRMDDAGNGPLAAVIRPQSLQAADSVMAVLGGFERSVPVAARLGFQPSCPMEVQVTDEPPGLPFAWAPAA